MELWLVRHGQTIANLQRLIQGQGGGKLTDLGIKQAQLLGQELGKTNFEKIFCSDLSRTHETMAYVVEEASWKHNPQVEFTPILREKSGGVMEGKPLAPKNHNKSANSGVRKFRPQNGESWQDVFSRADKFIDQMIHEYLFSEKKIDSGSDSARKSEEKMEIRRSYSGRNFNLVPEITSKQRCLDKNKNLNDEYHRILVVTHGGFIMEFLNSINFRQFGKRPIYANDSLNCSINIFRIQFSQVTKNKVTRKIEYQILKLNSIDHLQQKLPDLKIPPKLLPKKENSKKLDGEPKVLEEAQKEQNSPLKKKKQICKDRGICGIF